MLEMVGSYTGWMGQPAHIWESITIPKCELFTTILGEPKMENEKCFVCGSSEKETGLATNLCPMCFGLAQQVWDLAIDRMSEDAQPSNEEMCEFALEIGEDLEGFTYEMLDRLAEVTFTEFCP